MKKKSNRKQNKYYHTGRFSDEMPAIFELHQKVWQYYIKHGIIQYVQQYMTKDNYLESIEDTRKLAYKFFAYIWEKKYGEKNKEIFITDFTNSKFIDTDDVDKYGDEYFSEIKKKLENCE